MSKPVIIIGAGVNGITTALVLQLLGYKTTIYTEKRFSDSSDDPTFASLFPSASVIPHSVYSDHLETLFKDSQSIFYELKKRSFPGLSVHQHYEIFEFEKSRPEYLRWMRHFKMIEESEHNFPRRPEVDDFYGWSFDCIFADWPIYFPSLVEKYRKRGGEIIRKKIEPEDIASLPASTVINCSGVGSISLFDDQGKPLLMRGHLLHKQAAPLLRNGNDKVISYNYTPEASVYADPGGQPCDVYCYPRQDGWILGGSREEGKVNNEGQWEGEEMNSALTRIYETTFPSKIIDLNREIIEHSFELPFGDVEDLSPTIGYRFIRSESDGLRIDSETVGDKEVYHNYGHGGAGVTLSWGCALRIATEINHQKNSSTELKEKLLRAL